MRTRSQTRNRPQQQVPPNIEPFNLEEPIENQAPPVVTMADQRTMAQLLQAPTEGYDDAIVLPAINADNFELKHGGNGYLRKGQNRSQNDKTEHENRKTEREIAESGKAKLTYAVTPPLAFVKVVEEICVTCGGAHLYYQCLAANDNTFPEYRDNIQGYVAAAAASMSNQTNKLKNMMASFFQMNTASTSGTGSLPSNTIANPKGELKAITTRSGLVLDGPSVPIPPPFINPEEDERVEKTLTDPELAKYTIKSDPRVPLILGRPFLWTARALIDVHGEEMILRDGDERLILNMRHDTSSYSNQPHKESINMIDIYNVSHEEILEDLFATNHLSGNLTSSLTSHTDLTSPEVNDDIFDPEGGIIENLLNLDKTKDLPPYHDNPLSGSTISSSPSLRFLNRVFTYMLYREMESILEDSVEKNSPDDNLVDTISEMFTNEHALDYSSPPLWDDYDDELFDHESVNDNTYDDPFDFKEEKIKDAKILIDELDPRIQ
ncbi:hypothetical protein Tco_0282157 [Tanacetum coccineum]